MLVELERWRNDLLSIPTDSISDTCSNLLPTYPDFPNLYNCVLSIHQNFFQSSNNPPNQSNASKEEMDVSPPPSTSLSLPSNSTPVYPSGLILLKEGINGSSNDNNNNNVGISDLPDEILLMILQWCRNRILLEGNPGFLPLACVSKNWRCIVRKVSELIGWTGYLSNRQMRKTLLMLFMH